MFQIKEYSDELYEEVTALLVNLKKLYPTIESWWEEKELEKIKTGWNGEQCLVAMLDGKVGGVAISGIENKSISTAKIKTFYLGPKIQRLGIGPFLLERVLDYWFDRGIKKIFVTFAEEEVSELLPYFQLFGFQLEGIVPFNYRENVSEYHMSKLQVYGEINPNNLKDFSKEYLFRLRGYTTVKENGDYIVVQKLVSLKEPYKIFVKFLTKPNVPESILGEINTDAIKENCLSQIIVTYYPLDFMVNSEDKRIKIIDGYDLETMFYPLRLQREYFCGMLHSVKPEFGGQIFYDGCQTTLVPHKKSLRRDNMFIKYPQCHKQLKRGSICVLYETGTTKAIIGEAQIKNLYLDTPENLYSRFESKIVLKLDEMNEMVDNNGRVMAIEFGTRRKYKKAIPLRAVKEIINEFNPQGSRYLNQEELSRIRKLGEI